MKFYLYKGYQLKKVILVMCLLFSISAHADNGTFYVMGGDDVSNSVTDVKSKAWGVEEQTTSYNFGYLNEGHQLGDKRDGIYAMRRFSEQITQNVQTSFGIGPYFTATTVTQTDGIHYVDHYRWVALANATVTYTHNEYSVMARWNHVLYAASKDSDVFMVGVGMTFPPMTQKQKYDAWVKMKPADFN